LSGAVTTATTLKPFAINISRDGTANSGVPINMIRNVFISLKGAKYRKERKNLYIMV
jgi:hypothetical protein